MTKPQRFAALQFVERSVSLVFQRAMVVVLLFAGGVVVSCDRSGSRRENGPRVVALVDGETITLTDLRRALDSMKQAERRMLLNSERARRIKLDLLEKMIDAKLLLKEAKIKRIVLDPKAVDAIVEMIERDYPAGGLTEELLRQGKSMDLFQAETRNSLLIQKLLKREVVDRIANSRDEIEKYYSQNLDRFKHSEQVKVRQIVTKTEEKAKELRRQILRGASFEELARKHSLGPEAEQGGDLGFFSHGRMPPAIENACFKLKSSRVSQVVTSPYGYHLFQLIKRKPARKLTIEEAWEEVERELVTAKTQEAEEDYIRTLRDKASIKRDLQILESVQ